MSIKLVIIASLLTLLNADPAQNCNESKCSLPKCRCFSTDPPSGLTPKKTPQFVILTFTDAVQVENFGIYINLFKKKFNPDGSPVVATFFVPHEYTDYVLVRELYLRGHEIALNSVSHRPSTSYWKNISVENLTAEFRDQRTMLKHFAEIPAEAISGMRVPFLQLSGDKSFQVAKKLGLKYDCSWPTGEYIKPGLWPYTLDYASSQDCPIEPCPTSSIPGMWVAPMLQWTDLNGVHCSMQDACTNIANDTDGLLEWMKRNFNKQYKGNKAPFQFNLHSGWFRVNRARLEAYGKFIGYLMTLPDVFIVNAARVIQWMEEPVPIGSTKWPEPPAVQRRGCDPITCGYKLEETGERHMTQCSGSCPETYPWVNNPYGKPNRHNCK